MEECYKHHKTWSSCQCFPAPQLLQATVQDTNRHTETSRYGAEQFYLLQPYYKEWVPGLSGGG